MALKDLYQIIGKGVRELRDLKGLTQADLSAKTNINRATISNIESGKQQVSLHYLYLIAKALEVEAKEFLPSVSEIHILPNESLDILNEKFEEHNLDDLSKSNILQALNKNPDHGK
jgi:transcriptional regulator with XRE-family HTH domain